MNTPAVSILDPQPIPEQCGIFVPVFVTVAYMPEGRSEPEERQFQGGPQEDLTTLVDRALDEVWAEGSEPFAVYGPASGQELWRSRRW